MTGVAEHAPAATGATPWTATFPDGTALPTVTGGYLNAGDIVVVLAALLAGPLYGGVAAGFGSGLADVISGYMSYAPGTLVVKGCAAVVAALIFRACRKKNFGFALLSAICGEIIMVLGYFVFENFILGYGLEPDGSMRTILRRRVLTGLTVAQFFPQSPVIVTGGNPKNGKTEAGQMRGMLMLLGFQTLTEA